MYPWEESFAGTVRRAAVPGFATIYLGYVHAQLAPLPRSSSWEHQLIQRCDPDFNTKSCAPGTREGSQNLWALLSFSSHPDSFFCKWLLIYLAWNLTPNGHQRLKGCFLDSFAFIHVQFWSEVTSPQLVGSMFASGISSALFRGVALTWPKWDSFLQWLDRDALSNVSMTAVCNWLAILCDV